MIIVGMSCARSFHRCVANVDVNGIINLPNVCYLRIACEKAERLKQINQLHPQEYSTYVDRRLRHTFPSPRNAGAIYQ